MRVNLLIALLALVPVAAEGLGQADFSPRFRPLSQREVPRPPPSGSFLDAHAQRNAAVGESDERGSADEKDAVVDGRPTGHSKNVQR
jgi:hypothetical protein